MIGSAIAAAAEIFSPPFRAVLVKTIGLTILLLVFCAIGLEKLAMAYLVTPWHWASTLIQILAGLGLVVAVAVLVTPVSLVVAGFFFDQLADHVETDLAGPAGRGRALPIGEATWIGLKFGLVSLGVNLAALLLLLVPGVNAVAFFGANAYLIGRGFFELAALRYRPLAEVRELRQRHSLRIFGAGCLCAALASVPILNLLTPLFATALLVRVAQPLVRGRLPAPAQPLVL